MLRLGWSGRYPSRLRPGAATLGVRPEFVRPAAKGRLRAEVVRDEYQGACRYIHLQAECGRLVMRVADRDRDGCGRVFGFGLCPGAVVRSGE